MSLRSRGVTPFTIGVIAVYCAALAGLLWLLSACDRSSIAGPSSPPELPASPPGPPPRVDVEFSWSSYQGMIAFGLGNPQQTEQDVLAFINAGMAKGWNTFEKCAEAEFWTGDEAHYPNMPRDVERLRWFLEIVARVPGASVALIANCTLKRQVPLENQLTWAIDVANVVRGCQPYPSGTRICAPEAWPEFKNVTIFTHNEWDNCRGREDWGGRDEWCPGKQDIRQHIELFRSMGFPTVTADDSICAGPDVAKTYQFRLANIGARPASFHPCREVKGEPWDPLREELSEADTLRLYGPAVSGDLHYLQQLARYNGEFVLSEPVAWMDYSGRCSGLRTCDQDRINALIARCASVPECRMTFHSENGLAGLVPTWIPEAR